MIIPTLLLLCLGIAVIYSSSPGLAIQQIIFSIIGFAFYFLLRSFDFQILKPIVRQLYIVVVVLLVITLILGFETRGSVRWIPLGIFNFQPSEFAKPVIILALALFWSRNLPNWRNILLSLGILLPFAALIFRQPDLGTTLTVGFIWFTMLIAANISVLKLGLICLVGAILAPLSWFFLHPYQKQRFLSFLSPTQDPQGIGFHIIQSMIAVGSGQFIGRGLGRGTQSRLQFLPEFRTDFIFAFIAEELGFIGSIFVILSFSIIFWLLFRMLSSTGNRFGELILVGVMGMLFFQIAINIGMNTGIFPVTGITLPLLSYGGSSIVATLISLGLVESVARFGSKAREIHIFGKD